MKKTILILALLFSYCISAQTIVQLGGNQKIETFEFNDTSNILTLKLENSGIKTVDLSSLSGGGSGSDNQTITDLSLSGTVLSITIEDGNTQTLDLAPILGGGSTSIVGGNNVTVTGDGSAGDPFVINSSGGSGGNPSIVIANTLADITAAGAGAIVEVRSDITLTADYEVPEGQTLMFTTGSVNLGEHKLTGDNTKIVVNGDNLAIDTFYGEVDGTFVLPESVNIKNFGAKGVGRIIYDANIASGQNIVTSATANFTNDDIGKTIAVVGAVTGSKVLNTKITSITNSTTVVIEDSATLAVSNANAVVCYDDWNAFNNTLFLFNQNGKKLNIEGEFYHSSKQTTPLNADASVNWSLQGNNKIVRFLNGAYFQLIPHDLTQSRSFVIENAQNITIENPRFIGDRKIHGTEGVGKTEGNHAVVIRSLVKNIEIKNPSFSYYYGDGINSKHNQQFSNYIDGSDNVTGNTQSELAVGSISRVDGSTIDASNDTKIHTTDFLDLDNNLFENQLATGFEQNTYKLGGRSFQGWGDIRTPYYTAFYYDESGTTLLYVSPLQYIYDEVAILPEWKKMKIEFDTPIDLADVELMAAPQLISKGVVLKGGEIYENGRDGISNLPDNSIIDGVDFHDNGHLSAGPGADINLEDGRRYIRNITIQNCYFRDSWMNISLVGCENVYITGNTLLPNTRDLSDAPTNYPHTGIKASFGRGTRIVGNIIYERASDTDRQDIWTGNKFWGGSFTYSANNNKVSNNQFVDVFFKGSSDGQSNRIGYPTLISENTISFTRSIGQKNVFNDAEKCGAFENNKIYFNDISPFSYAATQNQMEFFFSENNETKLFQDSNTGVDYGGYFRGNEFFNGKPELNQRDINSGNAFFPLNKLEENEICTSLDFRYDAVKDYDLKGNNINGWVWFRLDNFPTTVSGEAKTIKLTDWTIAIDDSYNWNNTGANLLKTDARYVNFEWVRPKFILDVASSVTGAANRYFNWKHKGTTLIKDGFFKSETAKVIDFTNTNIFPADLGAITLINPKTDGITFVLRSQDKIIYTELENDLTDLQDGYVQSWDATDGVWKSVAQSSGGGGSATTDAADLTSGVLADARVQESNVTQHQAALSINASQIPDLPIAEGLDKTENLFLDNTTGSSPQLGVEWTFGGTNYKSWLSGLNGSTYFNWNHNGTSNSLLYSTTSIRPLNNDVLDLGTTGARFKRGWFSNSVEASGFKTIAGTAEVLLGNGTTTPNTFLSKPTISQYNISRTAALAQANGTVNFTSGGDLTYTIDSGTFEEGTRILVNNEGATSITITAGASVTVTGNTTLTTGQYTWLVQVSADEWLAL